MPATAPVIEDFIDQSTGAFATVARAQAAMLSGNYAGLTPVDADGAAVPASSPLSPRLQTTLAQIRANPNLIVSQPTNYLLLAAAAFLAWYFFLRNK